MKIKKLLCIFLSAVIIAVCLPICVFAEEEITASYVEDEVIFEYTPTASKNRRGIASLDDELESLGVTELSEINTYNCEITTSSVNSDPVLYVAKISGDVEEACSKLEQIDGINYAEPNYLFETDGFVMPMEIFNEANLYVTYQKWYLETVMHVTDAWEKYQTDGKGVTVAVIDNGFYVNATDFSIYLWDDGNGNHGWNTAMDNSDISPVYKPDGTALNDSSHGSNVAGIIGMDSNGVNGVGTAFNATLMLLKVARDCTSNSDTNTAITSDSLVSAIYYATNHGADIINMSLGTSAYPDALKNAIDNAYSKGVVLVAAAGNYGKSTDEYLCYPGAAKNVIGVMALDKEDPTMLASFSNYESTNGYYDIAAPGCAILGCGITANRFSLMNGTSQATPLVASCIALFLSVYPDATVDQVYNAVKNSATDFASPNSSVTTKKYSYGIMNALNLLDYGVSGYPELEFNLATTATLNSKKNYIYGLDENFADISNYVTVKEGTGTAELVPTVLGNGTGSLLKVYSTNGQLYETYTIVIFGDVNGDCKIDGQDAVIINCIANGFGSYSDYLEYAADVDNSNSVDSADAAITERYAIGLDYIDQFR